tara:strand:- start:1329 stop:1700 length:372 start_codon:yes stop_codon:yes gene_type:complete
MKITLSNEEILEFFLNALCNGLSYISGYGMTLDCDQGAYDEAKAKLTSPCFEDVYMQVLKDGGKLIFTDNEAEEDHEVTLAHVIERMPNVEAETLMEMANEQDDACTADVILQTIIFGEVIFG